MKNRKAKKGFTIIELVIVIAVIGILAAVLIPTFSGVIDNAKKTAAQSDASTAYEQYVFNRLSDENNKVDPSTDHFYIHSGNYYFLVENGMFDATVLDNVPSDNKLAIMKIEKNSLVVETVATVNP